MLFSPFYRYHRKRRDRDARAGRKVRHKAPGEGRRHTAWRGVRRLYFAPAVGEPAIAPGLRLLPEKPRAGRPGLGQPIAGLCRPERMPLLPPDQLRKMAAVSAPDRPLRQLP